MTSTLCLLSERAWSAPQGHVLVVALQRKTLYVAVQLQRQACMWACAAARGWGEEDGGRGRGREGKGKRREELRGGLRGDGSEDGSWRTFVVSYQ